MAMVTSYAVTLLGQACHLEFLIRNLVFPLYYLFIFLVRCAYKRPCGGGGIVGVGSPQLSWR